MKRTASIFVSSLVMLWLTVSGGSAQEKPEGTDNVRTQTLNQVYATGSAIESGAQFAIGHGVFSNIGKNLILFSAGSGWGVVRDPDAVERNYMRIASAGIDLGLEVKDFRGVFVFITRSAFDELLESDWDETLQPDGAAISGDGGETFEDANDVGPGIELDQLTAIGRGPFGEAASRACLSDHRCLRALPPGHLP